jgi:flagellar biosynthesis/type III secretory pathway protein FliH
MDQAARERNRYNEGLAEGRMEGLVEGRKEAEAAYQVIEEMRRKLREAGID